MNKYFIIFLLFIIYEEEVSSIQLLVPYFGKPDDASIKKIMKSSESLSVATVLKPNGVLDDDYKNSLLDLTSAGVAVYGYVTSEHATIDVATVLGRVDIYNSFEKKPDGIFIDQAASEISKYSYYNELYLALRKKFGCKTKVFIAPGTSVDSIFYGPTTDELTRAGDTIVLFDDDLKAFMNDQFDDYILNKADSESCALIHSCPKENMTLVVDKAISANIGFIYVTDKIINNPYDALSSYFEDLVAYIASK